MSGISEKVLTTAVLKLQGMGPADLGLLCDEMAAEQPFLMAMVCAQSCFGISAEKHQVLFELLLTTFQAMRNAGHRWPEVSEERIHLAIGLQARNAHRHEGLDVESKRADTEQRTNSHPERPQLAWFMGELFLKDPRPGPLENDKYWILAGMAIVDCVAFPDATELPSETEAS